MDDEAVPDPESPVVLPITGELDLHAFAPRDVVDVVSDYLDECQRAGIKEARLVHGRGKGVQRAEVRRLLASRDDVAACEDAEPSSGGWGATIVRLK